MVSTINFSTRIVLIISSKNSRLTFFFSAQTLKIYTNSVKSTPHYLFLDPHVWIYGVHILVACESLILIYALIPSSLVFRRWQSNHESHSMWYRMLHDLTEEETVISLKICPVLSGCATTKWSLLLVPIVDCSSTSATGAINTYNIKFLNRRIDADCVL